MSDPTEYSVSYSFAGFQAIAPGTPLPADRLDIELANLETSVGSLITALAEIRRSDGNLQNGKVSWDGLNADVQARITATNTRVTIGDINPAAFAVQAEAEAGVSDDKIMTPLAATQHVNAQRPYASQAQAQAGTATDVVLSPARATDFVNAVRALATQAQAEAGTSNTAVMTALRVAQALDALRPALTATASLTYGLISAGGSAIQTITVTGAAVNDRVVLGLPSNFEAGLLATAYVSAADTVRVRITNITGGAVTPNSGTAATYSVTVLQF